MIWAYLEVWLLHLMILNSEILAHAFPFGSTEHALSMNDLAWLVFDDKVKNKQLNWILFDDECSLL